MISKSERVIQPVCKCSTLWSNLPKLTYSTYHSREEENRSTMRSLLPISHPTHIHKVYFIVTYIQFAPLPFSLKFDQSVIGSQATMVPVSWKALSSQRQVCARKIPLFSKREEVRNDFDLMSTDPKEREKSVPLTCYTFFLTTDPYLPNMYTHTLYYVSLFLFLSIKESLEQYKYAIIGGLAKINYKVIWAVCFDFSRKYAHLCD